MANDESKNNEKVVLSSKFTGGPHGLGDPDDRSLRKVEIEILIPQIMRDKAKIEKCAEEVADFVKCGKERGFSMVFRCRDENSLLKSCLTQWYQDDGFKKECKEEYLTKRSEYRRTGIKTLKEKKK